jgi:carbon monoxide dehydrogenase subunit G
MFKPRGTPPGHAVGMATVVKTVRINARPDDVWSAVRDWTALHTRLVPGFVVDTRADGPDRLVTFFNGLTVREVMISSDDEHRRLAWSVVDGPYQHHNASAQVFPDGDGTRFVWTADFLPDELAGRIDEMMERGVSTVRQTMEAG